MFMGSCLGFFSNIDFKACLAWLDVFPSSQTAARAKPGSKLPLAAPMLPGRSSGKLSAIKTTKPPFTTPSHPKSETARHSELKNNRMQLWAHFSIISMDLGKNASQALLAPVAKGIFGAGGNSGAGVWGCDL